MWFLAIIIAQCITKSINYPSSFKLRSEFAVIPTADAIEPFVSYIAPPLHHLREIKVGQYAPLQSTQHGTEHTTKKTVRKTSENVEKNEQEKLEPRTDKLKCYNSNYNQNDNHNAEHFKTVSRSPGYNAVYRLVPFGLNSVFDNTPRAQDLSNEVVYATVKPKAEKKFVEKVKLKVKNPKPTPSNNTSTESKERKSVYVPISSIIRPYILDVDVQPKNYSIPLLVRHQWGINNKHKLHLNLARAYIPRVQTKSQRYAGVYSLDLEENI